MKTYAQPQLPALVRAVMVDADRKLPRCVAMAVLTSQTCGEPCWHAREEVCRCSCGGKNHGCLLTADGARPQRMAKIDGHRYKLAGVGLRADLLATAQEINGRQWRGMEKPATILDGQGVSSMSADEISEAKARGEKVWFSQYHYRWGESDGGAPARIKYATPAQFRWEELKGWQERAQLGLGVCLLWEIETMPAKPAEPRVSKDGRILANQSPMGEQI